MTTGERNGIPWKRVIVAAFLAEIAVIVCISAVFVSYRFLIAPGQPDAVYEEFGQDAGYYIAAPASGLATFVCAFLAARKLRSKVIATAFMVGVVETLLTVGFIFGARPSDRPMYIVSFIVRLIAGYLAGVVAARAASRGVESSAEPIRIQAPRS